MDKLNNLLLSKIVQNVSAFDICNLCLVNRIFYKKIGENSLLWTALIRSQFGKDILIDGSPIKYYYDNKRLAYGIISNESLLLCLTNNRKSLDKLTYLYRGIKSLSIGSTIVALITADENLVMCGTFHHWGKPTLELTELKFITSDVKTVVCMYDTLAFLDKDRNVYVYRPDDIVYQILANVISIESSNYRWGVNAITDDGFYSSIDFDIFIDDNTLIQTDNITISTIKFVDVYNIILTVNDIEQKIKFFTDKYCLADNGHLYKIIHDYDDINEIYNYSIEKLSDNVLFVSNFQNIDYWIDTEYRLLRKSQNNTLKIVHAFSTPVISFSSNGECLFILTNNGYLYTIGKFPGSKSIDPKTISDIPNIRLTNVNSYYYGFKAFICLFDN